MLATHTDLEARVGQPSGPRSCRHQRSHRTRIQLLERIGRKQAPGEVLTHDPLLDVITAEPEHHLRQVVGPEREEVRVAGYLTGQQGGPRRLDHRADHRGIDRINSGDLVKHPAPDQLQLGRRGHQRKHHRRMRMGPGLPQVSHGGQQRTCLHPVQALAHHRQTDATLAQHRIVFGAQRRIPTEELVQGCIKESDGDRQGRHCLQHRSEVDALHGTQFLQRRRLLVRVRRQQEPSDQRQAVAQEHVLGATQADSLGAEGPGPDGVVSTISVAPHADPVAAHLVCPSQQHVQFGNLGSSSHPGRPGEHLAGRAIQRDG